MEFRRIAGPVASITALPDESAGLEWAVAQYRVEAFLVNRIDRVPLALVPIRRAPALARCLATHGLATHAAAGCSAVALTVHASIAIAAGYHLRLQIAVRRMSSLRSPITVRRTASLRLAYRDITKT